MHTYLSENPRRTEVIFNQSGAELRIHDGGACATMLKNSIEEDLGSISMAPKMSRNFKINTFFFFFFFFFQCSFFLQLQHLLYLQYLYYTNIYTYNIFTNYTTYTYTT